MLWLWVVLFDPRGGGQTAVPLILTDPPYGDEAEPLYRWLAEWSARVLIPGGSQALTGF